MVNRGSIPRAWIFRFCPVPFTRSFKKLYFIDDAIAVVLIVPPLRPLPSTPHLLRQSSHHCSRPGVMHISSLATPFPMLYFTSPWLFYNSLFVLLNPFTSSPIPHMPLPSGNHQNALRIHDSVAVLVCLVWLLDSIIDRNLFFHFIVHSFYLFLK